MYRMMLLFIIAGILIVPTATAQDAEAIPPIAAMAWTTDVNVYLIAGGGVQTLFSQGSIALPSGPVWSQDGQQFAVAIFENHDIKRLFTGTPDQNELAPHTNIGWGSFTMSPDFERIAYVSNGDMFTVVPLDGSERAELIQFEPTDAATPGNWSPDGTWILYTAAGQIHRIHPDGTQDETLTPPTLVAGGGAWSPDGQWIAFAASIRQREDPADIFMVRADGTELQRLTDYREGAEAPVWSPDGSAIAFLANIRLDNESNLINQRDVFTVTRDGKHITRLTNTPANELAVQWSDGWIAFLREDVQFPNSGDVFVIRPDGGSETQMTTDLKANWFAIAPVIP
ncbi:MAG: hypothetical protein L0154_20540 [Chloroflexi bacterium]|nr:hypothetical protein [Chloroflexota bacterium]